MKFFITSDIHSFYNIFRDKLELSGFDYKCDDHKLAVCGDLFDRGTEPKQLLDFVQSLGDRFIYIRGNHEDLINDCVYEIVSGMSVSGHHYHNKTVDTIADFCDIDKQELYRVRIPDSTRHIVKEKMMPILEWINRKSIDYTCIGDYILVHGWVPIDYDVGSKNKHVIPEEMWSNREIWKEARWTNGMQAWKDKCRVDDKTIICGHWNCSWGHSHIRQDRKEFPDKSKKDWKKSFEPFIDDGIIAIDACTAYSGLCNIIILEVEE